jgi:two-component system NtrC family sensor kinase
VVIEVADTGPGIPPEIREKIFQPFFTTKPAGEGTGLGLSLCRNVVEEHKGTLALESEPGPGARFTVTLPVLAAAAATEPPMPPVTAAPAAGRRAILVVDDEPDVAGVLAEAFARAGHDVDVAHDGAAALERLGQRAYDLLVTDSKMPGMDGADFYREVMRLNPGMCGRIIFVTGDVLDREKLAFFESTGAPFLPKPFEVAEVRRVAQQILTSARAAQSPGSAGAVGVP